MQQEEDNEEEGRRQAENKEEIKEMKGMVVGKIENLESILWVGMQNAEIQGADIKQHVKEFSLLTVYLLKLQQQPGILFYN